MDKFELLNGLRAEYQPWQALLAQIGPARMDQPGVTGPWSIKDIVAHLTGWRSRTVARLEAAQRGEPEPPPPWPAQLQTDDEINAWIYDSNHGRSVRDVLAESDQVFRRLLAAIEGLPAAVLADPQSHFPWLEGQPFNAAQFFAHFHEEHEPQMRAWLARAEQPSGRAMNPADTLAMLFGHNLWANLRLLERCAALSPEQLDAAILGGYGSIRDTLQHIVTGEQLYLSIVSTGRRFDRKKNPPPVTLAEMAQAARITGAGLIEWAPRVQAADTYQEQWDGALLAVPKSMMLTQAINHATEHRAQIMATLTQLGIAPPELDGWSYYDSLLPVDEAAVVRHIMQAFPVVETSEAYGYTFFFDGPDHRLPFATMSSSDNEHDRVSNLDRPGVYRLNIGVSKPTFQSLFGAAPVDVSRVDFTTLDTLMPHPEYAPQSFICVLSPSKATFERVRPLLAEAYDIAARRHARHNQDE